MHTRINIIVKQSGLTKTGFGQRINVSQGLVSQICSGTTKPSDRTIADICREFGVNEVWLRTGEGEPFQQHTREEEIMRFAVRTAKGSDSFRKQLAFMLSPLDEDDWASLEEIYRKAAQKCKKSDRE